MSFATYMIEAITILFTTTHSADIRIVTTVFMDLAMELPDATMADENIQSLHHIPIVIVIQFLKESQLVNCAPDLS